MAAGAMVALAVLVAGCGGITTKSGGGTSSTSASSTSSTSSSTGGNTAGLVSYSQSQVASYYKANGSATVSAGQTVDITAGDLYFQPNTLTVTKGTKVTLSIKNAGAIEHTFTLPPFHINVVLQPGQSQTVSFTPTTSGTYYWYCAVPGHAQAGMVGKITVQ